MQNDLHYKVISHGGMWELYKNEMKLYKALINNA